jgi:hypothetical protein|nr:MAG TPA: hypothetical protein [Caudoviricetes sp.]
MFDMQGRVIPLLPLSRKINEEILLRKEVSDGKNNKSRHHCIDSGFTNYFDFPVGYEETAIALRLPCFFIIYYFYCFVKGISGSLLCWI